MQAQRVHPTASGLRFRRNSDSAVANRDVSGPRRVTRDGVASIVEGPLWSPNGNWIASKKSFAMGALHAVRRPPRRYGPPQAHHVGQVLARRMAADAPHVGQSHVEAATEESGMVSVALPGGEPDAYDVP